jgi:hypothetical protein
VPPRAAACKVAPDALRRTLKQLRRADRLGAPLVFVGSWMIASRMADDAR